MVRRKEVHGVKVVFVENHKARAATKVFPTGSYVWMLLADGSIGFNNRDFFRWAHVVTQRSSLHAAEAMWRLGVLPKKTYDGVLALVRSHEEDEGLRRAVGELRGTAKRLGLKLTAAQERTVATALMRKEP